MAYYDLVPVSKLVACNAKLQIRAKVINRGYILKFNIYEFTPK